MGPTERSGDVRCAVVDHIKKYLDEHKVVWHSTGWSSTTGIFHVGFVTSWDPLRINVNRLRFQTWLIVEDGEVAVNVGGLQIEKFLMADPQFPSTLERTIDLLIK